MRYLRLPRLLEELGLAHGDGRFAKLMSSYAKTDLLILDDWGLAPFTGEQRRDMLELLDDRYGQRSTIVTSQMPVDNWHELIGDPTLADAILDRLVHNAYRAPRTNHAALASLRSDCPAGWPWNRWPDVRGMPGRISVDWVAGWRGIRSYHDLADLLIGFKETMGILDVAKCECLGDDRAQRTGLQPLQNKSLCSL